METDERSGDRSATTAPIAQVVLKITDNGPGIPPHERSRVLDRFYRRPGTSPPGSGLGMAIVKAIADSHTAKLSLDGGPDGKGLTVSVSFPAVSPGALENQGVSGSPTAVERS